MLKDEQGTFVRLLRQKSEPVGNDEKRKKSDWSNFTSNPSKYTHTKGTICPFSYWLSLSIASLYAPSPQIGNKYFKLLSPQPSPLFIPHSFQHV